jgi:hypothetical protein
MCAHWGRGKRVKDGGCAWLGKPSKLPDGQEEYIWRAIIDRAWEKHKELQAKKVVQVKVQSIEDFCKNCHQNMINHESGKLSNFPCQLLSRFT